jgi:hypothetical protein
VYVRPATGPLSFWYEQPEVNERAFDDARQYFMRFQGKANYAGPFDHRGVPLLDYQGDIGRQYNPIAIAQYGLARFNRWCIDGGVADQRAWLTVADWLASTLRPNRYGVAVWMHNFNWPYREMLVAPWYSGLAQGNGLSMLVRAAGDGRLGRFADAAHRAFESFERPVAEGGVIVTDGRGHTWIEEYLVNPPSHILNGFIWALWGVYDYARWSRRRAAERLWDRCVETLENRLGDFQVDWWSLYEAPHRGRRMLASVYYHQLHITQLRVLFRLTGRPVFRDTADRFETWFANPVYRARALAEKALFKLWNY